MPPSIVWMKLRGLFVPVVLAGLVATSCGVAASPDAAEIDGRSIPASTVDALATDEAFAALVGFQVSDSDAVLVGSTARGILDFLLQGEALGLIAEDQGLDAAADEALLAETIDGMAAQGYAFGLEDLSEEAHDVLARFVAADRAVAAGGADFGTADEEDLRFAYEALEDSGLWERTCVTMVGGDPALAREAAAALEDGAALVDLPEEVEGIQLAVDAEVQCATGADLGTLPGDLPDAVGEALEGELVGPVEVEGAGQPLTVFFEVDSRETLGFDEARGELEPLVEQSLLAVRIARDTEVNPRYGGPVELEVVQGQVDPTGQALPALAARVSRPVAPDEG